LISVVGKAVEKNVENASAEFMVLACRKAARNAYPKGIAEASRSI
jgi:hypothetical protein